MIRLTIKYTGDAWYVNPNHIVDILNRKQGDNSSLVTTIKDELTVVESPEEVARKVLEWRLAMERYRAYVNAAALDEKPQSNESWELAANAKAELVRLAGLEEQNHDAG